MPGSHSQACDLVSVRAGPRNYRGDLKLLGVSTSRSELRTTVTHPLLRPMARITAVGSAQEQLRFLYCFGEERKKGETEN